MRSSVFVFRRRIGDAMRPDPLSTNAATGLGAALEAMRERRVSSVVVTDADGGVAGILTEQDVTRAVAFRLDADTPVAEAMVSPVETIEVDDYLYRAIGRMRRGGFRHMPATDAQGRLVGLLDLHEALGEATAPLMAEVERLTRDTSPAGLAATKRAEADLARRLLADGVPAPDVLALITDINRDLHRQALLAALARMDGDPPVPFCGLIFGSGGRGESYLGPDQDNGFIIADYPDEQHTEIDAWFAELAGHMTGILDEIGFPLCRGACMANNPVWRKTLSQWRTQIDIWTRRHSQVAVQLADIFFDFRAFYGESGLADDLRAAVTELAAARPPFLKAIYEETDRLGVALGWFGRLRTEDDGTIDLKHEGTLPLVSAVRLYALRNGVGEAGTAVRIAALADKGVFDADTADRLQHAFETLSELLLADQLAAEAAGGTVDNRIEPAALTRRERGELKRALKAIADIKSRLRSELTGDVF